MRGFDGGESTPTSCCQGVILCTGVENCASVERRLEHVPTVGQGIQVDIAGAGPSCERQQTCPRASRRSTPCRSFHAKRCCCRIGVHPNMGSDRGHVGGAVFAVAVLVNAVVWHVNCPGVNCRILVVAIAFQASCPSKSMSISVSVGCSRGTSVYTCNSPGAKGMEAAKSSTMKASPVR